jgi:hypothetical protein
MKWALERRIHYDGFEIVPWLADLAALSADVLAADFPSLRCRIHNHCVSEVEKACADVADSNGQPGLVFFPFNCFGNLADRDEVVAAFARHAGHVLVSGFQTTPEATGQRAAYYTHCGYTNVACSRDERGALATSGEGLYSYAFRRDFLEELFAGHGLRLKREIVFAGIGVAYHWASTGRGRAPRVASAQACAEARRAIPGCCAGIEVAVVEEGEPGRESTGLIHFASRGAALRQLSPTGILIECAQYLEPDARVKVDLLQLSPEENATVVGRVRRSEEITPGRYRVGIEFFGPGDAPRHPAPGS